MKTFQSIIQFYIIKKLNYYLWLYLIFYLLIFSGELCASRSRLLQMAETLFSHQPLHNRKNISMPSSIDYHSTQKRNFHNLKEKEMDLEQYTTLKKGFEIILPEEALKEKLYFSCKEGRPLNIKLGFDPTAPDLHLGHSVVLKKIREFQNYGHNVQIVIGDFTACIGDPTGRNKTRPPLTKIQVEQNAETYIKQLSKIINISKSNIYFNSAWFNKINFPEVIDLFSKLTLGQIMQRSDFRNRYENNLPISFNELVYPIMQGYDSIMVEADVEIGGTDQLFNCTVGRSLQSAMGIKSPQVVACMPILTGIDGKMKMSKSLGNYIGITEDSNNIFGKVMSIPDDLLPEYINFVSSFSEEEKSNKISYLRSQIINPMVIKKDLAINIVEQYYGREEAQLSADYFYNQVQLRDQTNKEFLEVFFDTLQLSTTEPTLLDLCHKLNPEKSRSELRRQIKTGAVQLEFIKILDPEHKISQLGKEEVKLKIGKRNFYRVVP